MRRTGTLDRHSPWRPLSTAGLALATLGAIIILPGCGSSSDAATSSSTQLAADSGPPAQAADEGGGTAGNGGAGGDGGLVSAAARCTGLEGTEVGGAIIRAAALVAATATTPEQCVVEGRVHDSLNFRISLPTHWNGKLLTIGGGGWNGSVPVSAYSASGNRDGYVIVSGDGGRQGDGLDASPFLDNPQAQQDFGYLSIHTNHQIAMDLVVRHYGRAPVYRYFEGCSNGGREALVQATRFPHDYDGIVVRAPAYSFTELFQQFITIGQALKRDGGGISDAKAAAIAKAVVETCDADDGVVDGLVSRPEACHFDAARLGCDVAGGETCLSDTELATTRAIYSALVRADSTPVYPGWAPGGEDLGWSTWVTGNAIGGTGLQLQFGTGLIRYWLTQDPSFDVLTFDAEAYRPQLALAATTLDAGYDLSHFFGRGGKLILVHGTHDWAISYKGSIRYFEQVALASGGGAVRDEHMEFFLQPGVQHCAGGVGPDVVDLLGPVSTWVEAGVRPSEQQVVASKLDATSGETVMTRPLCRYPSFPKYSGHGDVNAAASFSCQRE